LFLLVKIICGKTCFSSNANQMDFDWLPRPPLVSARDNHPLPQTDTQFCIGNAPLVGGAYHGERGPPDA